MLVAVADDQNDVRAALRVLIETEMELEMAFEAGRFDDLLTALDTTCLDLLLIDWELPGLHEAGALGTLLAKCPRTCIVAMSAYPEKRRDALAAGVDAFVCKGDPPERLITLIHDAGQCFVSRR